MSQAKVSHNNLNVEITNCLKNYMERETTYNCNSSEKTIYDELEEKENDLMLAAELGQALLSANEELKAKNEALIEEFQQKLYEMENVKLSLKKKLEAVECDYEMQLQALQKDIVTLRKDLNNQKKNQIIVLNEKNSEINEVMRHNEQLLSSLDIVKKDNSSLNHKLIEFEEKVNSERISMHEHVCQLELLKSEILSLREEKNQLETRIHEVMQEKNMLVAQLDQAQQQTEHLEKINTQNRETMAIQEQEVLNLQQTTEYLQNSINNLQRKNDNAMETSMGDDLSMFDNRARPANLWWNVWVANNEDGVEVDEDSVMANVAISNESPWDLMLGGQQDIDEENEPRFIHDLKIEVFDVYSQLRAICADLSFRNGSDGSKPGNTPDELALLEMDFKLGSLRNTLSELRGLLTDLMRPPSVCHQDTAMHSMMMRLEETRMVLDHKSRYLAQLQDELSLQENKLEELLFNDMDPSEDGDMMKQMVLHKKYDIEQRMTRTRSEMDVLTTSMIQQEADEFQKLPDFSEDYCEYD